MTNPHAALIEQYCQDWQETDTPWERWQLKSGAGPWIQMTAHPSWRYDIDYRRKPDTIVVNGIECNAPLRVAPKVGAECWLAVEQTPGFTWRDTVYDLLRLENGLVCATSEDAQALWIAMTAPMRAYVGGGK